MLGVFVEFETNLRRERRLEGIADAKARGVYKGGKKFRFGTHLEVASPNEISACQRCIAASPITTFSFLIYL
jgi:DNA invertase Pin-like site-specific DNA recombinase